MLLLRVALFLPVLGLARAGLGMPKSPDALNVDEDFNRDIACFWKRFCDDAQPLEYKEIIDIMTDSVVKVFMGKLYDVTDPEDIHGEYVSLEHFRSDDTWTGFYQPFLCSRPEETKKKYVNRYVEQFVNGMQEICEKDGRGPDCNSIVKGTVVFRGNMEKRRMARECL